MFPVLSGNNPSGYNLTRSLRFRASASANLSRTPSGSASQIMWTWSGWVKRGKLGATQILFSCYAFTSADYQTYFGFTSDDKFQFYNAWGGATSLQNLITTQVFRDPSAWYHVVVAVDMSQGTYQNAIKIYVNGVQVTAFGTSSFTNANNTTAVNGAQPHAIGTYATQNTNYFDGYLAEVNFINSQTLTPSSFGSTNALTGVWQPAAYTGTYGTNGFYLPFTDNSALTTSSNVGLGRDYSGNGNYWTTNNISITAGVTYDSMTDVPTLTSAASTNFCTMNPVYVSDIKAAPTLADANLTINPFYDGFINGTIALPPSGKFYWEATVVTATTGANQTALGVNTNQGNNRVQHNFVSVLNDVWGVAVDINSLSVSWYKNNVLDTTKLLSAGLEYFPFFYTDTNTSPTQQWAVNFGQRPFTYTAPSGYVALNTYNLPTSTIVKGNTVMDATLYTGTGASLSVTNTASFKPDLVWVKGRSGATDHAWYDSVRGTTKQLESNTTDAETTQATGLTAFGSAGFTVGALAQMNTSAATYVGWQWQAGQGTNTTNTNGTITSTVSVNASAGFSVLTYTGTGAAATVGHGLGVAPSMIIVKNRDATDAWQVYHSYNTANPETDYLVLNTSAATADAADRWNDTAPTSSVFSIGNGVEVNTNTEKYVAYCWTPIAGYSAFGSYTGNGSADGSFVYTGFRPKFVMFKRTDAADDWVIFDTARNTYNVMGNELYANLSSAEGTGYSSLDIVSNGFKLRSTGARFNASGGTYIYAAFAENPFKNALAR